MTPPSNSIRMTLSQLTRRATPSKPEEPQKSPQNGTTASSPSSSPVNRLSQMTNHSVAGWQSCSTR